MTLEEIEAQVIGMRIALSMLVKHMGDAELRRQLISAAQAAESRGLFDAMTDE